MNGLTKTIIALLPAIIVHAIAFFVKESSYGSDSLVWVIGALLLVGGALSGVFLTGPLIRSGQTGKVFLGVLLFLFILVGYAAGFFFTGCLLSYAGN